MKPKFISALLFAGVLSTVLPAAEIHPAIAAEMARGAALVKGDADTVAAVLADDLLYTHSNGRRESKQDVLLGLQNKSLAYERFELGDLEVREITHSVVVLTGKIDQRKLGRNGGWADAKLLFHAVWRNESGRWRLASMQTVMPPKSAAP